MVASCHLSSYLVRTFSDLGSVNITQRKKKGFPSFYAKVKRFKQSRALTIACRVSKEPVQFDANNCSAEPATPGSRLAAPQLERG